MKYKIKLDQIICDDIKDVNDIILWYSTYHM